jgi:hypothetical protein
VKLVPHKLPNESENNKSLGFIVKEVLFPMLREKEGTVALHVVI